MHALSIFLTVVVVLAGIGLLYEVEASHRKARYQAHSQREWERLNARSAARGRGGR